PVRRRQRLRAPRDQLARECCQSSLRATDAGFVLFKPLRISFEDVADYRRGLARYVNDLILRERPTIAKCPEDAERSFVHG
ncbi:MAG: hypothetical protein WBN38_01825, partial [Polyangiales bacterium]